MLRVTFLLCDMPVRLVPCLVDCKPGKTPNRGQVFPYLLLCREQWSSRTHNMRGWTRTGFSDNLRCVNSFHNTSLFVKYCVFFYSTVTLRFVSNRANRSTTQNSLPSVVVAFILTVYSKVHFVSYQTGRCGGFCKT